MPHPRIAEVLAHLESSRVALAEAVALVPEAQRDRRPAPDRWSVAEVLEHLALVDGRITGLLRSRIDAAREAGLGAETETSPVVPTIDLARLLDRERRITAGEASLPKESLDAATAWERLVAQQDELRELALSADGLALGEVIAPNPVIGPLNVYQWLAFVGGHERRHALQIREIADSMA